MQASDLADTSDLADASRSPDSLTQAMGLSSVSAEVTIDDAGKLYTSNDVVSGTVVVNLKKSKPIEMVEISLLCTVHAVVRLNEDFTEVYHGDIYRRKVCVFPSPDMPKIGKGVYSMAEGDHPYPFEFRLPSDRPLPQSLYIFDYNTSIHWNIKVKVSRKGAPNVYDTKNFTYTPLGPQLKPPSPDRRRWLDGSRKFWAHNPEASHGLMARLSRKNQTECQIDCRLTYPKDGLEQAPLMAYLGLEIQCSCPHMVMIDKLVIGLRQHVRVHDDKRRYSSAISFKTDIIAKFEPRRPLEKITSLNDLLADIEIPKQTGSLDVTNIQNVYYLSAEMEFSSVHSPSYTKKLSMSTQVVVRPRRAGQRNETLPSYSKVDSVLPQFQ